MSVLITGVAGRLAHIVAQRLGDDEERIGMGVRASPKDFPGRCVQVKRYNHRSVAEVFRETRPRVLLHLGIRAVSPNTLEKRYTENVLGTQYLLKLCQRYGVERVVVLGTFHVYGAHEHNAIGIREDAPLRAGQRFPEIVDVVELDHAVSNFVWRHDEVSTVLLRICNIIGPSLRNRITRLLSSRRAPRLMGFDPMMQFIHEEDAADAVVKAARSPRRGVYNVAGEGAIAYSHAIRRAGGRPITIPHVLAYPLIGASTMWGGDFPPHLIDYFRYPTIIDDRAFRHDFRFTPRWTTVDALAALRTRNPQGRLPFARSSAPA